MNVIYEDNHVLVIDKPCNLPSQLDDSQDVDLVHVAKAYLKEKYQKPGNVYLGLVHRLDRPVSGLMVLAKTSKAASRLSEQVRTHQIEKHYTAIVLHPLKPGVYQDYLAKNAKTNTSYISNEKQGKKAQLEVLSCSSIHDQLFKLEINLITGRPHQIRVQCASRRAYLYGDQRYNPQAKKGQQIALAATYLSFFHPITKEKLEFKLDQVHRFPFIKEKN